MGSPSNRVDIGGMEYPCWESLSGPTSDLLGDVGALTAALTRNLETVADWKLQYETLTELQRIAKHDAPVLLSSVCISNPSNAAPGYTEVSSPSGPMTMVERLSEPILACVGSLRSSLSKNAMLTISAFVRGLGNDYIKCMANLHATRTSPLRLTRVNQYPRVLTLVNTLLQKASSTAEKKFIQVAADDTLSLLTAQPQGTEPLLSVILKIMKECKNSRVIGACGNIILKCWQTISSEWVCGAEIDLMETVINLTSQAIPILLADKNPASRTAAKRLTDDMRKCAASIDQQPIALLPLPERTNMSQYITSVWGTVNASITSPSMRLSFAKFLGLQNASSSNGCRMFGEHHKSPSLDATSRITRSPQQQTKQSISASSSLRSPERLAPATRVLPKTMGSTTKSRLIVPPQTQSSLPTTTRRNIAQQLTSTSILTKSMPDVSSTRASCVIRARSTQTNAKLLATRRAQSHCGQRGALLTAPKEVDAIVECSKPTATFALPTRSSQLPTWQSGHSSIKHQRLTSFHCKSTSMDSTSLSSTNTQRAIRSQRPSIDYARVLDSHRTNVRPHIATVPAVSLRPGTQSQTVSNFRGRRPCENKDDLQLRHSAATSTLPPRGIMIRQNKTASGPMHRPPQLQRPQGLPSLPCSNTASTALDSSTGTYGRGSSGGLMEKSVTTVSTAASSHEDRLLSANIMLNHSARDRGRSVSTRLRALSARRSFSVSGRTGTLCSTPSVAPGPPELPPWLLIDDDSTEEP
eukprot:Gregarina_sp_Poly_1__2211@NODE_158_length_12340_cov_321_502159_g140_i0_p3_GENE_NODE_158_length_12340_cov_321_502159_g140_i0NODE_158_length_12340_cov_321_502159_g140_i0_p3_ORF_typecomplete_len753_score61_28CLASP_N/PF12348_8/3_6e15_NODE_158_length_12340_cov_321_502159_g140_i0652323